MRNQAIAAARKALGLSTPELARRVGVSAGTIQNLEAGHMPKLATARRIAKALRLKLDDLWPAEAA